MKRLYANTYSSPDISVMTLGAEGCFAVSGGNENSGSKPGKFDKNFDWSNFDNFKF